MIVIDTGKKGGAISFFDSGVPKSVFLFEMQNDIFLNLVEFHDWLLEQNDNEVVIERIPLVPHGNVKTIAEQNFHVGCIYATMNIALEALDYDLREVWPIQWTSGIIRLHNRLEPQFQTPVDTAKRKTEAVAMHYFPELCKKYTPRSRVNDAVSDCLGIYIYANIDKYLAD